MNTRPAPEDLSVLKALDHEKYEKLPANLEEVARGSRETIARTFTVLNRLRRCGWVSREDWHPEEYLRDSAWKITDEGRTALRGEAS